MARKLTDKELLEIWHQVYKMANIDVDEPGLDEMEIMIQITERTMEAE